MRHSAASRDMKGEMKLRMRDVLSAGFALGLTLLNSLPANSQENFGRYEGTVQAEWLDDGRQMKLLADFAYIDPNEIRWIAPAGSIIDGASIPRVLWSGFGSPFTGKYRDASVIHDVACDEQNRTWELVHLAFYYAMRASEVDEVQAQAAYGAVYHLGPRWKLTLDRTEETTAQLETSETICIGHTCTVVAKGTVVTMSADAITVSPPEPHLSEQEVEQLMQEIEARHASGNPFSLDEIRQYGR
jgi:hypothetical protein